MRVASIDLGTNTAGLLIADREDKNLEIIKKLITITRLGGGFNKLNKTLSNASIERSIKVLLDYSMLIKKYNVQKVKAVATSIVRNSSNASLFLERILNETGLEIEIISGLDEARLSSIGVINSVEIDKELCLIVDIGGGSTELILLDNGEFVKFFSVDLGVVSLTENYITCDIPSKEELLGIKNCISVKLNPIINNILSFVDTKNLLVICNAGTPSTIACSINRLKVFDPKTVNGCIITKMEMMNFFRRISIVSPSKRLKIYPAIEKGREDLIISGVLILENTLELLRADKFKVSQGGLLEGILHEIH